MVASISGQVKYYVEEIFQDLCISSFPPGAFTATDILKMLYGKYLFPGKYFLLGKYFLPGNSYLESISIMASTIDFYF